MYSGVLGCILSDLDAFTIDYPITIGSNCAQQIPFTMYAIYGLLRSIVKKFNLCPHWVKWVKILKIVVWGSVSFVILNSNNIRQEWP